MVDQSRSSFEEEKKENILGQKRWPVILKDLNNQKLECL